MNIKLLRNRTRLLMFGLVSVVTAYSFSSFKNCTTAEGMPQNNSPVVAQPAEAPVANTSQDITNRAQQITDLFEGIINDGMQSPGYDSLGSAAPVVDVPVVEKPQTPTVDDKAQNVAAAPATKAEGDNVTVTVKPGEDGKATVKAELDKRGASENESVSDSSAASEATVSELEGYKKSELKKFLKIVRDFAGVKDGDSKGVFDKDTRKGFIKKISSAKDGEVESLKSVVKNAVSKMSNINGLGDVVRPLQGFLENLLDLKDLSEDKKRAIENDLENFKTSLKAVNSDIRKSSVLSIVGSMVTKCSQLVAGGADNNLVGTRFTESADLFTTAKDLKKIIERLNSQSQLNPAIIDFLFLSKFIGLTHGSSGKMLEIYRQYAFGSNAANYNGCLVVSLLQRILNAKENGGVFSSNRTDDSNFSFREYRYVSGDTIQIESLSDARKIVGDLLDLITKLTTPISSQALESMNISEEVAAVFGELVSEQSKQYNRSYRVIDFIRDYSLLESVLVRVLSQAFEKNSLGTTDAIQLNSIYQGSFESVDSIKKLYFDRSSQEGLKDLELPGNSKGYGIGKFSQYDVYKFLTGTSAGDIGVDVSSGASGVEFGKDLRSGLLPAFGGKMLLTGKAAAYAIMAYAGCNPVVGADVLRPMKKYDEHSGADNKGKDPFWTKLREHFGVNQNLLSGNAFAKGFSDYNDAFSCLVGDINNLYVGSYDNVLSSEPVEAFKSMSEEPFNTMADVGEHSTFSTQLRQFPWASVYFSCKNPEKAKEAGYVVGGDWAAYGIDGAVKNQIKAMYDFVLTNPDSGKLYRLATIQGAAPFRVYPTSPQTSTGTDLPDNQGVNEFPYCIWYLDPATYNAVQLPQGFNTWLSGNDLKGTPLYRGVFGRLDKDKSGVVSAKVAYEPFMLQSNDPKPGEFNYISSNYEANSGAAYGNLVDVARFDTSDVRSSKDLYSVTKQRPSIEKSNQAVVASWFSLIKNKKFLDILNRFRGKFSSGNVQGEGFSGFSNFGFEFLPGNKEIKPNMRRQTVGRGTEIVSTYNREDKFNLSGYLGARYNANGGSEKEAIDSYYSICSQNFASDSPHFFATLVDLLSFDGGIIGGFRSSGLGKAFKEAGVKVDSSDMALVYQLLVGVLSEKSENDKNRLDVGGLMDFLDSY